MAIVLPVSQWPDKYVGEKRLFGVNWSAALGGDTINPASVIAVVEQGDCVVDDPVVSFLDGDGITQKVWISAGSPGVHWVACKATTAAGQELEARQWFWVRE